GHGGAGGHGEMGMMPSMALVELSDVTHTAVQSGDWSDPATWAGQSVPGEGARVHIPGGIEVSVDGELAPELKTVRVDGKLSFATDVNTELRVDTLVTTQTGTLEIGTEAAPIDADVTARIVFADDGAIDQSWDPALVSRGALLHGQTTIFGAEKLAFAALSEPVLAGTDQITLNADPTGWRVDDAITIAGTEAGNPLSDEVVTITAIDGRTITFEPPLDLDHVPPRADLDIHVANLTRNVSFSSENEDIEHRGHVMFMHTNDADVRYFSMQGLGRTNKAEELEDWRLLSGSEQSIGPELTEVEDLGGTNIRGRYSLHFHRAGDEGEAARVEGAVVRDDPGWAYVNHSSNVDFIGNVSHNVVGAAFNTEAGDEIGSFVGNIAIRTYNPDGNPNAPDFEANEDQSPDIRVLTQDFGWQGDGFWFHGPGVTVENNVVSGASGHAYIYWPLGLVEKDEGEALMDVENLPNWETYFQPGDEVRPKQVPVPSFDGNLAYGAAKGLNIAYLHTDNRDDNDEFHESIGVLDPVPQAWEDQLQSTFSNFTAWNIDLNAIAAPYSGRLTFENIDVIGTGQDFSVGVKLDQFDNENDITLRNLQIDGFDVGLAAPRQGQGLIDGAQIVARTTDLRIIMPDGTPRDLTIRNVEFLDQSLIFGDLSEREHVGMSAANDLGLAGGLFGDEEGFFDEPNLLNVPPIFLPDRIIYETAEGEVLGLYFDLQDPTFIPVVRGGELARFVPEELVGLSNRELQDQFGFSAGGEVSLATSAPSFLSGGYAGTPLDPFAQFPPAPNPYWVDFLETFDVEIPWAGAGAPPDAGGGAGNGGDTPTDPGGDGGPGGSGPDDEPGDDGGPAGPDPDDDEEDGGPAGPGLDDDEDAGESIDPEPDEEGDDDDMPDGPTDPGDGDDEDDPEDEPSDDEDPEDEPSPPSDDPDEDDLEDEVIFDGDELDRRAEREREREREEAEEEFAVIDDREELDRQAEREREREAEEEESAYKEDREEQDKEHFVDEEWFFDLLAMLKREEEEEEHACVECLEDHGFEDDADAEPPVDDGYY
ncbi:MAG: G8 domain-containing protein, partial [Pseudomonadota bacterium]